MSNAVTIKKTPAAKKATKVDPSKTVQDLSMQLLRANLDMRPIDEQIFELQEQKKQFDEKAAHIRTMLGIVMAEIYEQTDQKTFENHLIKLTYTAPHTASRIDTTRLKAEQPKIAAKYTTVSDVKGSVRITVK